MARTTKRDGKHILGAGTAGSLARKYGPRRCVGHSLVPRARKSHRFATGRSDFWELESRAQGGMCACPEVTLLRRVPLWPRGGSATAFSELQAVAVAWSLFT